MSAIVTGCCCSTVPCSPSFSCPELKGTVDWTLSQSFEFNRVFTGVITNCCDYGLPLGICDQPNPQGPITSGLVDTSFTGDVTFDYSYTTAIDLPQSISVSNPPTRAELCSLAVWQDSVSSNCSTVVNTRDVATDLEFEITYKYGGGAMCSSGEYGQWNYKLIGDMEIEWVTEPSHSINGNLQTYTQGVGEHYSQQLCSGTDCLTDECVTDWLVDGSGQIRVRWNTTLFEYAADDLNQATPTFTDTYTSSWTTVDIEADHRSLYGPMQTCSFKVGPQQTLESSIESLWSSVKTAIVTSLNEALVYQTSRPVPGVVPTAQVTVSGANPNTGDGYFAGSTTFYTGVEDDLGSVNASNAEWNTPTFCQVLLNYRKPTSMVYERVMDFDASFVGGPCVQCTGPTSSLLGLDNYYLSAKSELSILFITPDSTC